MAAEKCSELVENISNSSGDEVIQYLEALSVLVNNSPSSAHDLARLIPCELLFNCLKSSNSEQNLHCKSILKKVLKFEKPDVAATKYHDYVIEGMNHPLSEIREMCLSEVERCSGSVNGVLALVDKGDLLAYVARCIADENLACAKIACSVFTNAATHELGLKALYQQQLQSEFNELLLNKEVVRLRVFEMFIEIQSISDEAFKACQRAGILDKLVHELEGDDVLVQMNCLELLTSLASSSEHGLQYLDEHGVMVRLHDMLLNAEGNPLMDLVIPGIIKFFGHLAHQRPIEVTQKYPQFMEHIYSQISCGDIRLMPIAIETIGVIARTEPGLRAIFTNATRNKHVMKVLFNHAMSTDSDLCLRGFEALSSIFFTQENPSSDLSLFVQALYAEMANNPLEAIVTVAKQPFVELRCAALKLMTSLSKYDWAQQDMVSCPGYLEYLLDRRTEPEKSGKELKYELIVELVHSPSTKQVFGVPYYLKLKEYEREGPFYARAETAVAFEGAD